MGSSKLHNKVDLERVLDQCVQAYYDYPDNHIQLPRIQQYADNIIVTLKLNVNFDELVTKHKMGIKNPH
jgi:hypothetical protein